MNWEQKLHALDALGECTLSMRQPGNWYVSQRDVAIVKGHIESAGTGNGPSPEAAVEDVWKRKVTALADDEVLFVRSQKQYVRWNGFMWRDVEKPS